MIVFRGYGYRYPGDGPPVLHDLDLEIGAGEFVLVVGASGSGKSTLLRALNGLVPHFYGGTVSGSLTVAGCDPVALGPRQMSRHVGLVFQDPESQFVLDTVEDELAFAMENHALPPTIMRKRVEEVLDQLDIAHLRRRRVGTLSGGEKQRVAIASVLTLQPQILVLDEPTSQLDPQAAEEVLTVLQRLNADLGLTVVLSEHRLERVVQYADRVVHLPGPGRPIDAGTPHEVLPRLDLEAALWRLGRALGWAPLPLTIKEARPLAAALPLPEEDDARPAAARPGEVEIVVDDLWHRYNGQPSLCGVSLEVRRGEVLALMGRNGSGKTTLLKQMVGLLRPERGTVHVRTLDTRAASVDEIIRLVGYVPQDPNTLLFAETVTDEVAFTRRAHGLPLAGAEGLLAELGLDGLAQRYPRDLSVGERQRVALAAVLAAEPEVILLDEPTRGLDYGQKRALMAYLHAQRARGRTVVLSTHDVELVAEAADRVVILAEGRVAVEGDVREVMSESLLFTTQIGKLFGGRRYLTVGDVLGALP